MQRIDDAFSPETSVEGVKDNEKIEIETIVSNLKLGETKIRNAALSLSPPLGASRLFDLTGTSAPARSNVLDLS
jgi:hypothetical protein